MDVGKYLNQINSVICPWISSANHNKQQDCSHNPDRVSWGLSQNQMSNRDYSGTMVVWMYLFSFQKLKTEVENLLDIHVMLIYIKCKIFLKLKLIVNWRLSSNDLFFCLMIFQEKQARIASLYLPLYGLILDNMPRFFLRDLFPIYFTSSDQVSQGGVWCFWFPANLAWSVHTSIAAGQSNGN